MTNNLKILLAVALVAGVVAAGGVSSTFRVKNNGVALPSHNNINFTGGTCVDDPVNATTNCALGGASFFVDAGSGSIYSRNTITNPDGGIALKANSLMVRPVTAGASSFCSVLQSQPGYSFGTMHSTSSWSLGAWPNENCEGSQWVAVGQLNFNLNSPMIAGSQNSFMRMAYGYEAPLAFASFPTCNGSTQGRELFDSTNNVWKWCDGTSWVSFTSGGPTNFWADGGSGSITTTAAPVNAFRFTTGTPTTNSELGAYCMQNPSGSAWMLDTSQASQWMLKYDSATPILCPRPGFTATALSYNMSTNVFAITGSTTGTQAFTSSAASGSNAHAATVTGARWDLGAGANDYLVSDGTNVSAPVAFSSTAASGSNGHATTVNGARWDRGTATNDYDISDGTGISTPGYYTSTQAFNTAALAGQSGNAFGFSAQAQTSYEVGDAFPTNLALSYNSGARALMMTNSTTGFLPTAAPIATKPVVSALAHPVHDRGHTMSMLIGQEFAGCPTVRENIAYSGPNTNYANNYIVGRCITSNSSSTVRNAMRNFAFVSGGSIGDTAGWFTTDATTAAAGTLTARAFTTTTQLPRMCARLDLSAGYTGRTFLGLFNGLPSTGSSSSDSPGVFWRIDTTVSATQWYMCGSDGTTTSCTANANATYSANTPIELCIDMTSSSVPHWYVNGRYTANTPATMPSASTNLTPIVRHENTTAAARTLYVYSLSVESW